MNIDEQRRKTREKVARWRKANATRLAMERQADSYLKPARPRVGRWVVREWHWPDGSAFSGLPMAVTTLPVGRSWKAIESLPVRLRGWFRLFMEIGIAPIECNLFVPTIPLNLSTARDCCRLRVATIVRDCGGVPPEWLVTVPEIGM